MALLMLNLKICVFACMVICFVVSFVTYQILLTSDEHVMRMDDSVSSVCNSPFAKLYTPELGGYRWTDGQPLEGFQRERCVPFKFTIAMCVAITTKHKGAITYNMGNMQQLMPIWKSLMPSFCRTASPGYHYPFYFTYDVNDEYFNQAWFRKNFTTTFTEVVSNMCPNSSMYSVRYTKLTHKATIAWAQNDGVISAYMDGADYMYRTNDDTNMPVPKWTEEFVACLQSFGNVGICGPNHRQGNYRVLTYEFVHRTHIDIHGFHYPRVFPSWDNDVWLSRIYQKSQTYRKIMTQYLDHTMEFGVRYKPKRVEGHLFQRLLTAGYLRTMRYIGVVAKNITSDPRKVIAMSLSSNDSHHMWGVIRNAQLMRVIFPEYVLRVYVANPGQDPSEMLPTSKLLPEKVKRNLLRLGAKLYPVNSTTAKSLPSSVWRLLAADDPEVDVFLVRNEEQRLSERDARAVASWLTTHTQYPVHCIRDIPAHVESPIARGLWGAQRQNLTSLLGTNMHDILLSLSKGNKSLPNAEEVFLNHYLWPKLSAKYIVCHDGTQCVTSPHTIPMPRFKSVFKSGVRVGTEFDQFEDVMVKNATHHARVCPSSTR